MKRRTWIMVAVVGMTIGAAYLVWGRRGSDSLDPLDVKSAIAAAREDRPEKLIRLSSLLAQLPSLSPAKGDLPQYHRYLHEKNGFINHFAVQAIVRIRSKQSLRPLRDFATRAKERLKEKTMSSGESMALQLALQTSIYALGELGGQDEGALAFLQGQLKNDSPLEWGGAVAHNALSKQGRDGLRLLLTEAKEADAREIEYIATAIARIDDPSAMKDLHAACQDTQYPYRIRFSALSALAQMRSDDGPAEDLMINVLRDEQSDLRKAAALLVGVSGSERGQKALTDVLRGLDKPSDDDLKSAIAKALRKGSPEDSLPWILDRILAVEAPTSEKRALCEELASMDKRVLAPHFSSLKKCLRVVDEKGRPVNEARITIWLLLYRMSGRKLPLELQYESVRQMERVTYPIRDLLVKEIDKKRILSFEQARAAAKKDVMQVVVRWDGNQKEKQP